jgi:hypothetical protein
MSMGAWAQCGEGLGWRPPAGDSLTGPAKPEEHRCTSQIAVPRG